MNAPVVGTPDETIVLLRFRVVPTSVGLLWKTPHTALRFVPIRILNLIKFTIRINPHSSRGKTWGKKISGSPEA